MSTYSRQEPLRNKAVNTLKSFFEKFSRSGRYTVLNYYLHDNSTDQTLNNYVSAYLIYLFKEEVAATLDQNEPFYKCANFRYNKIVGLTELFLNQKNEALSRCLYYLLNNNCK